MAALSTLAALCSLSVALSPSHFSRSAAASFARTPAVSFARTPAASFARMPGSSTAPLASCRAAAAAPPRAAARMSGEPPAVERVFATLPYVLPFLDGFQYGLYVFNNVPGGVGFAEAVLPLVIAFNSLPFSGIIFFIGLSFFTRPDSGLSRFVRFNIQQALVLDILLIIPSLFSGAAGMVPSSVAIIGSNFVFYTMALVVTYALYSNARGELPDQVPVISEAAGLQIGPF
eukprot:CAMPEP_0185349320 /NCGR_PEP_ID=MMETSP1364-20130426/2250_1 /TAXON_ID=38817 /ORGANISM="Gephyrocapsa oceanica, Strain RCC1303" /LENGTH=230 /DNA_ID=CAMNT_0027948811 /DNA_START=11 /DNA_END=703 /DNA_ORIENTATION=-